MKRSAALAALIVVVATRLDRRSLLAPAAVLALPLLWFHGLALLVAMTPLNRLDRKARATSPSPHAFSVRALVAKHA